MESLISFMGKKKRKKKHVGGKKEKKKKFVRLQSPRHGLTFTWVGC